jgi:hypothetical protein
MFEIINERSCLMAKEGGHVSGVNCLVLSIFRVKIAPFKTSERIENYIVIL